jgi:diaminopimelate epimerase
MTLPQTVYKAHATGNDFVVYIDADGTFEPTADEVRSLCDRHFGIGGDGLIRLAPVRRVSDLDVEQVERTCQAGAHWFMDYRNADGSYAEMCGNGTRAITLLAVKQGVIDLSDGSAFLLGTRAGVKQLRSLGDLEPYGRDVYRVEVGAWRIGRSDAYEVSLPGQSVRLSGTFVDMGNPHVVALMGSDTGVDALSELERLDLTVKPVVNPVIESDQNVEFVRIDHIDDNNGTGKATMRVNERGCGETLSCGTGLCATAVTLRAKTGVSHWDITVRGGLLHVDVTDAGVSLTGSATIVARISLC